MEIEEIWEEFQRSLDIALAGRRILELARKLKEELLLYLRGGRRRSKERKRRDVRLIGANLIPLPRPKVHLRYPSEAELIEALAWALRRAEERREIIEISRISSFDLAKQIESARALIDELRREGRESVTLREISSLLGGFIMALLALLFLEKHGDVFLFQEEPFGEILVVLRGELLEESEEAA